MQMHTSRILHTPAAYSQIFTFVVASQLVSIGKHTLPGGVEVEITFPRCKDSDSEDEADDDDSEAQPCEYFMCKLWKYSRVVFTETTPPGGKVLQTMIYYDKFQVKSYHSIQHKILLK